VVKGFTDFVQFLDFFAVLPEFVFVVETFFGQLPDLHFVVLGVEQLALGFF
jgi:hypothetical protein